MNDEKARFAASLAREVGQALIDELAPACEPGYIVLAGSLRRERPTVGDIEILYVPRIGIDRSTGELFPPVRTLTEPVIAQWLRTGTLTRRPNSRGHFAWGEKNKLAVHVESGIPVDLFVTTAENWAMSLVVRTGSKETNLKLTTGAQARGLSMNAYGCGFTRLSDGEVLPVQSEQEVFEIAGVPYLEPKER